MPYPNYQAPFPSGAQEGHRSQTVCPVSALVKHPDCWRCGDRLKGFQRLRNGTHGKAVSRRPGDTEFSPLASVGATADVISKLLKFLSLPVLKDFSVYFASLSPSCLLSLSLSLPPACSPPPPNAGSREDNSEEDSSNQTNADFQLLQFAPIRTSLKPVSRVSGHV